MFFIRDKQIHMTRGDYGVIDFSIPVTDQNKYLKYVDSNEAIYWYDEKNKVLYDNYYQESMVDIKTLILQLHTFKKDDVVRFKVFKKKDCGCVEIQIDVPVTQETTNIDIPLSKEDTKIGDLINKPAEYWYEIELNPDTEPQTVIGYDIDGEKKFILYPEGDDKA